MNADLPVARNIRQRYLPDSFTPSTELLSQIDDGYGLGDELCDAWLTDADQLPQKGMPMFRTALTEGVDRVEEAPDSLKALFDQANTVPDWFVPDMAVVASKALERYPIQQGLMLQSVALMGGYSIPGLVQPLLETGSLQNSVVARMGRTLAFVAAVTLPGGVRVGDVGYQQALHVRIVHGLIRARLRSSDNWQHKRFGVPINQTDMIATSMQFSLMVIHGLIAFGCHLSQEERAAILHLWRYIGYLMGLDQNLVPMTEDECNQWLYSFLVTQQMDALNAHDLAQALHELPVLLDGDTRKARKEQQFRAAITRFYWGDKVASDLGLPNPSWPRVAIPGVSVAQNGADYLRRYLSPVEHVLTWISVRYRDHVKGQYLRANPELLPVFTQIEEAYFKHTGQAGA